MRVHMGRKTGKSRAIQITPHGFRLLYADHIKDCTTCAKHKSLHYWAVRCEKGYKLRTDYFAALRRKRHDV